MREYRQISLEEREKIYQYQLKGYSYSQISRLINRDKSTISREIRRNGHERVGYLPDRANNLARGRKRRNLSKIEKDLFLKQYILTKLCEAKWSPEMIAGRLKLEKLQTVAHETIYQWIYSITGQKQRLYQHLMYARPKRQQKYGRKHRYKVADIYKIRNRPEIINNRSEFGHFEGDLTFFKGSKNGNFAVLAERKSRFSFLIVNSCKRSQAVMPKIVECLKQLPQHARKSVTFDNGGEFSQFGLLSLIGTKTYFCNPGSPWQKGQVERTNAQLHKFIPKKSNFNSISEKMAIDAQNKLNNLPRKCLGFLTPTEVYANHLHNSVALHS